MWSCPRQSFSLSLLSPQLNIPFPHTASRRKVRCVYNAQGGALVLLSVGIVFKSPGPNLLPIFVRRRLPTVGMRHEGEDIPGRNKFIPSGYPQSRKGVPTALACGYSLSPDSQVTRGRRARRQRRSDYKPILLQCGLISQDEFDGLMGMEELLKFGEARRKVAKTREVNAGVLALRTGCRTSQCTDRQTTHRRCNNTLPPHNPHHLRQQDSHHSGPGRRGKTEGYVGNALWLGCQY